jgi:hypothetical protein
MKKSILFLTAFASITSSTALAHETNPVSCTKTKPATATATAQQQKVPWLFAQNTENIEYRREDAAQHDTINDGSDIVPHDDATRRDTIDDGSDIVPHDDATRRDTIDDGSDIVPHDDATRRDTIDDANHDPDDNDGNM